MARYIGINTFMAPGSFFNLGVSPGHVINKAFRGFTARRFVPFFNAVCNFFDNNNMNPMLQWDKVRAQKKGHFPNGVSFKMWMHFGHLVNRKRLMYFDYGYIVNRFVYGKWVAPDIDLTKITDVPIAIFCGSKDPMSTVRDNHWLRRQLKSVLVYYKEFRAGHISFQLGRDVSYFADMDKLLLEYA